MSKFSYGEHLTQGEHIISGKFGAAANAFTDADKGYPVKLTQDSRWEKCVENDPIGGFVKSLEPFTVESYSFGGVQVGGFKSAVVTGPIAIGDTVKAGVGGKLKRHTIVADASANPRTIWQYVSGQVNAGAVDCIGVVMRIA
jgi:hypothetical protein